jgi:hypothetical protein
MSAPLSRTFNPNLIPLGPRKVRTEKAPRIDPTLVEAQEKLHVALPGVLDFLNSKEVGRLKATTRLFSSLPTTPEDRAAYASEMKGMRWDCSKKRPLKIESIVFESAPLIAAISRAAKSWINHKAFSMDVFVLSDLLTRERTKNRFIEAQHMSSLIVRSMKALEFNLSQKVFEAGCICRDRYYNLIQGIILYKTTKMKMPDDLAAQDYLYVTYLVSSSRNIRSSLNTDALERVEGVGTTMIVEMAKKCLHDKLAGICLNALDDAVSFYQKMGFLFLKSGLNTNLMLLSANRIDALSRGLDSPLFNISAVS